MELTSPAPVALFVYKRPEHTEHVVQALKDNPMASETPLIVYSDAARDSESESGVRDVRSLIRGIRGFRRVDIRERPRNWGLSRSLTAGVKEVVDEHDQVVVLEDDLVVSTYFLDFMNAGLRIYRHEERIASIHGYRYPGPKTLPETFFLRGADCWGWATWARAWRHYNANGEELIQQLKRRRLKRAFDFDGAFPFSRMLEAQVEGRVDSWAVRWYASAFLDDLLTLYPGRSLVRNIGTDGSGEHSGSGEAFAVDLASAPVHVQKQPVEESAIARRAFADFLRQQRPSYVRRALRRTSRLVRR